MTELIHPAALPAEALQRECDVRFQRRSGPGGQHRNKVETGVFVRHRPSGTTAQACERRQQAENLPIAWSRLRLRLAVDVRVPWEQPSPLWQSRCGGSRVQVAQRHPDFAALLAEALDALSHFNWQLPAAAASLQTTSSQLVKLLRREPKAFQQLNAARRALGLGPVA